MDNEKSERPERRTAFIARELKRHHVDIAALQETRLPDEGQLTEVGGGYTFFWKGKPSSERRLYGIGFAIKTDLVRTLDRLPVGVNERLMTLQLNLRNKRSATLISAYAPTLIADQQRKEEFYSDLDDILSKIPQSSKILLLGDFNARVGRNHEVWKKVIGCNGVGKCNSNGEMLLTKCAEYNLAITNTIFRQKNKRKTSWRHPRSGHWHLIDFIIVRQSDLRDVYLTHAVEATDSCWTDHRMIVSNINFNIQPKQRNTQRRKPGKYNIRYLNQPEIRAKFQSNLAAGLKDIDTETTDTIWNGLKAVVTEQCRSHLGKQLRYNEDWFDESDEEIQSMMARKRILFTSWHKDYRNERKRREYHEAKRAINIRVRKLKNDWWIAKSEEMQKSCG